MRNSDTGPEGRRTAVPADAVLTDADGMIGMGFFPDEVGITPAQRPTMLTAPGSGRSAS